MLQGVQRTLSAFSIFCTLAYGSRDLPGSRVKLSAALGFLCFAFASDDVSAGCPTVLALISSAFWSSFTGVVGRDMGEVQNDVCCGKKRAASLSLTLRTRQTRQVTGSVTGST